MSGPRPRLNEAKAVEVEVVSAGRAAELAPIKVIEARPMGETVGAFWYEVKLADGRRGRLSIPKGETR